MTALAVVVVTHDSASHLPALLAGLAAQMVDGDELIVVDGGSADDGPAIARDHPAVTRVVDAGGNVGFAAAANLGAAAATAPVLVFLNPDCAPAAGFLAAMRSPPPWAAAWMGLPLRGDGTVDSAGGRVHLLGFAWARGHGGPPPAGAAAREVDALSGACLAIPRARFTEMGGFWAPLFMYHEDVDLSLRLRLAGGRLALLPGAAVRHEHDLVRGDWKWRLLERNRPAVVARCWPGPLLVILAPALLASQALVLMVAARGGWGRAAAGGAIAGLRLLPAALRTRRGIQRGRSCGTARFCSRLSVRIERAPLRAAGRAGAR